MIRAILLAMATVATRTAETMAARTPVAASATAARLRDHADIGFLARERRKREVAKPAPRNFGRIRAESDQIESFEESGAARLAPIWGNRLGGLGADHLVRAMHRQNHEIYGDRREVIRSAHRP
jgi:hypothetical protein